MEVLITRRMVELVRSEAAKCRAQSMSKMQFASNWAEVADALEAATAVLSEKLEAQNASWRCG